MRVNLPPNPSTVAPERLGYQVEGLDCASCAQKVDQALRSLPGVQGLHVSVTERTLHLTLDHAVTSPEVIEGRLRALGYPASLLSAQPGSAQPGFAAGTGRRPAPSRQVWRLAGLSVLTLLLVGWDLSIHMGGHVHVGYGPRGLSGWLLAVVALLAAFPVARRAWAEARFRLSPGIHALVTLAVLGAVIIGACGEALLVTVLFQVGEVLEGLAAKRASGGLQALAALLPSSARLLHGDDPLSSHTHQVPSESLRAGQRILVRPGDRLPADGVIESGTSRVDEAFLTGESLPVTRQPGDHLSAGTVNLEGALTVVVTRGAGEHAVARALGLVREAEARQSRAARFLDRFAARYVPLVIGLAAATALIPPAFFGADAYAWVYRALGLLLIGCPCALLLSVPTSVTSAIASAAQRGILIKGGDALETLGLVQSVALDKTGTLTYGEPHVQSLLSFGVSEDEALSLAAAAEQHASHPLARAVLREAHHRGLSLRPALEARTAPGQGALGTVGGMQVAVGSARFAAQFTAAQIDEKTAQVARATEELEAAGQTVVLVVAGGQVVGLLGLIDTLRADAAAAMQALAAMNIGAAVLSGDRERAVRAVIDGLNPGTTGRLKTGGPQTENLPLSVQAELLPEDKWRVIEAMAHSRGPVAMVGDGLNDAPALARADVGVAMGGGADAALESADVVLLRPSLLGLVEALRLGRATRRIIRQNVALAMGIKLLVLGTTFLGLTGLWAAVLADTGATLLVTLNALRLLNTRPGPLAETIQVPATAVPATAVPAGSAAPH